MSAANEETESDTELRQKLIEMLEEILQDEELETYWNGEVVERHKGKLQDETLEIKREVLERMERRLLDEELEIKRKKLANIIHPILRKTYPAYSILTVRHNIEYGDTKWIQWEKLTASTTEQKEIEKSAKEIAYLSRLQTRRDDYWAPILRQRRWLRQYHERKQREEAWNNAGLFRRALSWIGIIPIDVTPSSDQGGE